jgi:RNA polymerase sigma-70 factor (ECF subfamily)
VDSRFEIQQLLTRFRAGETEAGAELCSRFGPVIRAAVRRHLHRRLRDVFDSLDFVQDVWASFLSAPAERHAFTTPHEMARYLARVAHNKVIDVVRQRFETQKHDLTREVPGDPDEAYTASSVRNPSPSQWAIAAEEWERLLLRLPPGHRVVAQRLREGHDHEDIARMTSLSLSTVNRIVRRMKELTRL